MLFPREFHMLSQEGHLAQSSLLAGIEALGKLNYDKPGTFYAAFFQLSIGLERLMKIAVILDHKGRNGLRNPPGKQVRALGHDLVEAYSLCKQLAMARGNSADQWFDLDTVEHDVLVHISLFAQGARYYNLDSFSERQDFSDPIVEWAGVHRKIANQYISGLRQKKINHLAIAHCNRFKLFGYERSISGEYRTQVDCTFEHELFKQSNRYCAWTVFRLLSPFYFLFIRLCDEIHQVEREKGIKQITVPYMHELFPFMLCDRATATRRKKWVGIY